MKKLKLRIAKFDRMLVGKVAGYMSKMERSGK